MTRSNWKETIELVGILAIVASLIALVMELRQTQSALSAQTYQARAIDAIGESLYIADSEYIVSILTATNIGTDYEAVANLNTDDPMRLLHFLRARMVDWDNEHYQYQNGFLDADFFEETTQKMVIKWAPAWRNIGITEGREEFRNFVDQVLAETPKSAE